MREIFDKAQLAKNDVVLSYLIANITRWTTHSIAFARIIRLKEPLRQAAITQREDIIKAHVGAEKNKKKVAKMKATAERLCHSKIIRFTHLNSSQILRYPR